MARLSGTVHSGALDAEPTAPHPPRPPGRSECRYIQAMIPLDGSDPSGFRGVDCAIRFRGSAVHDRTIIEGPVLDLIVDVLAHDGIAGRKCHPAGLGWVVGGNLLHLAALLHDNYQVLAGILTWIAARYAFAHKWYRFAARRVNDHILNPFVPNVRVELGVHAAADAIQDLSAVIRLVPELHRKLREGFPSIRFSFNIFTLLGPGRGIHIFISLQNPNESVIARVIRRIDRKRSTHARALHVYQRFGIVTVVKSVNSSAGLRELIYNS